MMRSLTRRITRARRVFAALALVVLVSLLVLPTIALAAQNLVTDYETPGFWTVGSDDEDSLSLNGEYGEGVDSWGGTADIFVKLKTPTNPYTGQPEENYFTSFEDFAARSGGSVTLYGSADQVAVQVDYVWTGAQKTTLGGLEAWSNIGVFKEYANPDAGKFSNWFQTAYQYWIPTEDGGIYISAGGYVASDDTEANFDAMRNDIESTIASLRFNVSGASSAPGVPGAPGGSSTWRTVVGGAAAVAAAAVALAGAAASARAKSGAEEPPPDQPIGYVLQLSATRLTVSEAHPSTLTIQAFRVLPSGQYQPASEVGIAVTPSSGVSVQPSSAYGTLSASVWQTGSIALGSGIAIQATAPLGTTQATVTVAAAGESRIVTRFEPAGTLELRTEGGDSLTLVALVELMGADIDNPAVDAASTRASIAFASESEWLSISAPADYDDGRAVTVIATQPDPTAVVQPPESATIRVTAQAGERVLTAITTIPLARIPSVDARPDSVTLAAGRGESAEITVWVESGGGGQWHFDTEWREGSRPLATPDITPTGPATATLTLTESAGDRLDPARARTDATLMIVATAEGFNPVRREVQVIVAREGLFIDPVGRHPEDDRFRIAADGSAAVTKVDLRVFVRDEETGEVHASPSLAQQIVVEPAGEPGTAGHAGLAAGGLRIEPLGLRGVENPSATFGLSLEHPLPTAGEVVSATLSATVPGHDDPLFTALVPLGLAGIDTEPYSELWQTEIDRCRYVIDNLVPPEHRTRLHELVSTRGATMGAEGVYQMRRRLADFAQDQLLKEKHEHLDAEWWYGQIEDTLDWVSWCGDIALGVASGAYLGVVGSIA
ncbi:MAG: hypothetical protein ACYC77_11905, partial [Coriobacteriia bacterium]